MHKPQNSGPRPWDVHGETSGDDIIAPPMPKRQTTRQRPRDHDKSVAHIPRPQMKTAVQGEIGEME